MAKFLTEWPQGEATGRPVATVFRSENERTRRPVEVPVAEVFATGASVRVANHVHLIARDGTEWVLDDSAAPIRDAAGTVVGAVLMFRDVTDRRRAERAVEDARAFFEGIVETVREPLVVLGPDLRMGEPVPDRELNLRLPDHRVAHRRARGEQFR